MKTLKQMAVVANKTAPAFASAYDYSALDATIAKEARDAAAKIYELATQVKAANLKIGWALIAIRHKLPPGKFVEWIRAEFDWSMSTAYNYMAAARLAEESPVVEKLPPKAIYALAAKNTPDEVKKQVIGKIEKGESLTAGNVMSLIKAAKDKVTHLNAKLAEPSNFNAETAKIDAVNILTQRLTADERTDFANLCRIAGWSDLADAIDKSSPEQNDTLAAA